jgi:hypothetical protein
MASDENRGCGKSISAEELLSRQMPPETELARRRGLLRQALEIQRISSGGEATFPSSEEMQRADRRR